MPFSLSLHQEGSDIFRVVTDLQDRLSISDLEAHQIIERALIGVVALTQTIGEMKVYSAISGFRDNELPLFRHKLDFLSDVASSQTKETDFRRVIDLAELPDFPINEGKVDVEKLLKVRDSSEAREFRDWLGGIGNADDKDIRDRISGLRAKVGLKTNDSIGKTMRFLTTTLLGLFPPTIAPAIVLSVVDQFVLERLLPKSGIAAFVNELYPSIFRSGQ